MCVKVTQTIQNVSPRLTLKMTARKKLRQNLKSLKRILTTLCCVALVRIDATTAHLFESKTMPSGRGPSKKKGGGRIQPHQRETNDEAPVLGSEMPTEENHLASALETEKKEMDDKCRKNCRNCVSHTCEFLEKEHPEHCKVGVQRLSPQEKNDPQNFYHECTHDLVHAGLNANMTKAFLASKKTKANGNTCSHANTRTQHTPSYGVANRKRRNCRQLSMWKWTSFLIHSKRKRSMPRKKGSTTNKKLIQ